MEVLDSDMNIVYSENIEVRSERRNVYRDGYFIHHWAYDGVVLKKNKYRERNRGRFRDIVASTVLKTFRSLNSRIKCDSSKETLHKNMIT